MAIKKQVIKSKPVVKVTFSVEAKDAQAVSVVGDFNNWNPQLGELAKQKNGSFKATFEVAKDANYEFKYFVDGAYINEPEADAFQWNAFANAENSVLAV